MLRFQDDNEADFYFFWKKFFPAAVVFVILSFVAIRLIGPPCPKRLVIATGSSEGAYYAFAKQYAEVLARHGITLEVRATAGSVENLALLRGDNDVSLAIVQGGAETPPDRTASVALASLYLEPLWVFYRNDVPIDQIGSLREATVAIGPPGSGTRALSLKLLEANGLYEPDTGRIAVRTEPLAGREAAAALTAGRLHAAFFVVSPQSAVVRELLESDGIRLMSIRRAESYTPKHPYLSKVTLHEGVINLDRNVPAVDVDLVAANATLVARDGIHPAVIPLLLKTVREVHGTGGTFAEPGTYPSPHGVCLPIHADSRRFFETGPSFLYRIAPFRLAAWLDRMKILLLPLCTLVIPFFRILPPLYRWRIRQRIYRWYRVLRDIETNMGRAGDRTDFSADLKRLERLELELIDVSVPLSYMEEFYNLRLHISHMRDRLNERARQAVPRPARTAA